MKHLKDYTQPELAEMERVDLAKASLTLSKTSQHYYMTAEGKREYINIIGKCVHLPRFLMAERLSDGVNVAIHDSRYNAVTK